MRLFERTPAPAMRLLPQAMWRVPERRREIFLTFDDGPHPGHTPPLLNLLDRHDVRATFFLVGEKAKTHPGIVRDLVAAGHRIGNHTMHHRQLRWQRRVVVQEEIYTAQQVLENCAQTPIRLFRPPYGALSSAILRTVKACDLRLTMWSVMPGDVWRAEDPAAITRSILTKSRDGDILLLHDGHRCAPATIAALREAIPALKERAFRFSLIPDGGLSTKN